MFQRLVAIPQQEYLQLTAAQQVKQPELRQFYDLQKKYEEQSNIPDPYEKLMHQSETLETMKGLKERMRNDIVTASPKPYQSRVRSLFQHVEPVMKFNERGEIYDEHHNTIPNSRLEDLIQYAVRDRRRPNFIPAGWDAFKKILKTHNIPKYMLNRDTLDELERKHEDSPTPSRKRVIKQETMSPSVKRPRISPKQPRKRKPVEKYGFLKSF